MGSSRPTFRLSKLVTLLRRSRASRRRLGNSKLFRFEQLEHRCLLHAGDDINGPHASNPAYDPNAAFHIHADLRVFVNSQPVAIPAGVGDSIGHDLHTHAADGRLHIHPQTPSGQFITLDDWFQVWHNDTTAGNPTASLSATQLMGNNVDATHTLRMFVNGSPVHSFEEYQIHDQDDIVLVYGSNPVVTLNTNVGPIVVELFATPTSTPGLLRAGQTGPVDTSETVAAFLDYVNSGEYQNMFFHRSESNFVIQGGRLTTATGDVANTGEIGFVPKGSNITNEPGLSNIRGTLAMARRGGAVNSATSEFYINLAANTSLDTLDQGFTVFGQVLEMSTVDAIAALNVQSVSTNVFEALLTGTQEVPAVSTSAEGGAQVHYNATAGTFDLNIFLQGITKANLTQSHIHVGAVGAEGSVIFDLGDSSQWVQEAGGLRRTLTNATFPAANAADLLAGRTYVNIHTTAFPDGQIRGQLSRASTSNAPVTASSQLVFLQSVAGDGVVRGLAFNDLDGDGTRDTAEPGLASFTIFSDANNNGVLDTSERSTTTNSDGTYRLELPAGTHRIRQVPNAAFSVAPSTGHTVNLAIGAEIDNTNFANAVPGLSAPTLLVASNSGSASDTITSFNNHTAARALQLQVTNPRAGATVRIYVDGVRFGEGTATTGNLTITTNGTSTIADGTHQITATQVVNGVESAPSPSLSVTIDTTIGFSSTPPTAAVVGNDLNYDAQSTEEGSAGFAYSLGNTAPAGATIDSATGVLHWTPATADLGTRTFEILATDAAGNTTSQALSIDVRSAFDMYYRIATTDLSGTAITSINVGDEFNLNVFVKDLRTQAQVGIFAAYLDVLYDSHVETAGAFVYGPSYPNAHTGDTNTAGLLNEVGAFASTGGALGSNEFLLFSIKMRAAIAGTANFSGNPADVLPAGQTLYFEPPSAVPTGLIDYRSATLTVNLGAGANGDLFNVDEDTFGVPLDVLANDQRFSPGGPALNITTVGTASNGATVSIDTVNKRLLFTPAPNYVGEVRFTYNITDGTNNDSATVIVQVANVNDDPSAVNDSLTVTQNTSNNLLDVLLNDDDAPDVGETLTVTAVGTLSSGGSATVAPDGKTIRYTPRVGFSGNETFTYTIRDGHGGQDTATVTVNVLGSNAPPNAVNDTFTVTEDSTPAVAANVFDVLANDTTSDTGETLSLVTGFNFAPSNGGSIRIANGKLEYTPAANFFGTETFTYQINDGRGGLDTATVTVTVTGTNDPPTAAADAVRVFSGASQEQLNVLANDSSAPDANETLTITQVGTASAGGTVTISSNGQRILYTPPNSTFTGTDTFTYTIRDSNNSTAQATVTVTVQNFVPRAIGGVVAGDLLTGGTGREALFGGYQLALAGTDSFGQSVTKTATSAANGTFMFPDLAPGNYTVSRSESPFLLPGEQQLQLTSAATAGDSLNNVLHQPGRRAQFISLLDFLGSTPRESIIAAVKPGAAQGWYYFNQGWDQFHTADVRLSANSSQIVLTVNNGSARTATINSADRSRVQFLGQENGYQLVRLVGASNRFNLQPATTTATTTATGEGEAGSRVAPQTITPAAATTQSFAMASDNSSTTQTPLFAAVSPLATSSLLSRVIVPAVANLSTSLTNPTDTERRTDVVFSQLGESDAWEPHHSQSVTDHHHDDLLDELHSDHEHPE